MKYLCVYFSSSHFIFTAPEIDGRIEIKKGGKKNSVSVCVGLVRDENKK